MRFISRTKLFQEKLFRSPRSCVFEASAESHWCRWFSNHLGLKQGRRLEWHFLQPVQEVMCTRVVKLNTKARSGKGFKWDRQFLLGVYFSRILKQLSSLPGYLISKLVSLSTFSVPVIKILPLEHQNIGLNIRRQYDNWVSMFQPFQNHINV
jgi:hypothetical protein